MSSCYCIPDSIDPCRFLYILYLAVDANFKLKGKNWKLQDIELMPGGGAFVEESAYQAHICNYVDQPEVRCHVFYGIFLLICIIQISTCQSEHDAIVWASTRNTPGYAVSSTFLCPTGTDWNRLVPISSTRIPSWTLISERIPSGSNQNLRIL